MDLVLVLTTVLVAVTAGATVIAGAVIVRRWRSAPLLRPIAVILFGAGLWSVVALGLRLTEDPEVAAVVVAYLLPAAGISMFAGLWHACLLAGLDGARVRLWLRVAAVEPALLLGVALVAPWRQLVFVVRATGEGFEVVYLPSFYVHLAYSLLVFVATVALYVDASRRAVPGERGSYVAMIVTYALPLVVNAVALTARMTAAQASSLTAVAILPVPVVWWWGAVRTTRMQHVPLSATRVLTEMGDAVLVLRDEDRVVFANHKAMDLVRRWAPVDVLVGRGLGEALGDAAAGLMRAGRLVAPDGTAVDVQLTILGDGGRYPATVVAARDVTEVERLRAELTEQASRDGLTGLHNRRYLGEVVGPLVAEASRGRRALTAVMIDVDHFKEVNDRFGHSVGDRVLVAVAEVLAGSVRAGDVLVRFGGEEFLALLPGARCAEVAARAEQWRTRCADLRVATPDGPVTLTVSIGMAQACAGDAPDDLLRRADAAMYAAKAAGRDRVQARDCDPEMTALTTP